MGYRKNRMIQEDQQGWSFAPDGRHVCDECFDDDARKEFVRENAKQLVCDYCERESEEPIAAPINEVMELIGESLFSESNHPDGEDDALGYGWRDFVKAVKYQKRYVFALTTKRKDPISSDSIPPGEMLRRIGDVIEQVELVRTMEKGTVWFRGRLHDQGQMWAAAAELGSAPAKRARSSNRRSPAGIPMFYGAEDENTAVLETCSHRPGARGIVTVGAFETAREVSVVDLSDVPEVPSLLDTDRRHLRRGISGRAPA